ncbi:MAG TPA: hypothetical protein ENJ27_00755 [Candidatus Moranbacteria bacterium]|nr:hypothetical protein [Candidatus Moranbacteria bacterium]
MFLFKKKEKEVIVDEDIVSTAGNSSMWTLQDGTTFNDKEISLETYDKMSRHYQIRFSLAVIKYTLQQIDWFIKTDDEVVKNMITVSLEKIWNSLIHSISKSFRHGFSASVKVFEVDVIDGKKYINYKKIKDLDPADCTVIVDENGNFDGFWYRKGTEYEKKIEPMYSFWYVTDMENGNLYGNSFLDNVYKPWWYSEKIHIFANRYYERFGEPLVVGRSPTNAKIKDSSGNTKDAGDVMISLIEDLRNHSSLSLPSDRNAETKELLYDIKFLESQMRGFDFETYLNRLDQEISRGLFTPELIYGGGSGGSFALGTIQIQTFYTNLRGIMDNIKDYVNLYIIPQLVRYNFSGEHNVKFEYQPITVEDVKSMFEMINIMIKNGDIKPDTGQLEERTGFKFKEVTNNSK